MLPLDDFLSVYEDDIFNTEMNDDEQNDMIQLNFVIFEYLRVLERTFVQYKDNMHRSQENQMLQLKLEIFYQGIKRRKFEFSSLYGRCGIADKVQEYKDQGLLPLISQF